MDVNEALYAIMWACIGFSSGCALAALVSYRTPTKIVRMVRPSFGGRVKFHSLMARLHAVQSRLGG